MAGTQLGQIFVIFVGQGILYLTSRKWFIPIMCELTGIRRCGLMENSVESGQWTT